VSDIPRSTDVLIAGAGPVGLTLATVLADAGVDAVVVDQAAEAANTSRAAVVHARTLEVLRELDLADDLIAQGIVASRFTVREHDRVLLTVDFDELPTDFPFALLVPQDVTERLLTARLRKAGGDVHRPYRLTGLDVDAGGVRGTLAGGETVRARYLVGCDGMHSFVREQTGIEFTGDSYPESFVLADVRLSWSEPNDQVALYFSADGVTVVAPLPGGRHRIVATVDEAPEKPSLADVQALLDARGPRRQPARVDEVGWSSRFRVHHRLAAHYRSGRLLLAGDAAHVHSPAGGQGMNTGIQDAVALGHKLTAVLQGAAETVLDEYEAERRPVAEEVVAFTHRMTRVATVGSAPLRGVRNTALRALDWIPAVHRTMAMSLSELANRPAEER
jgi:2-polyprenyl-6-methoxyphenol hydroxylase-like FAD-dependent oxidoreductase